ncbi:alpha/beta fold hydrolase [[Mycobacterium] burgundiense]|uniref:Alpha/beta hydrolase n=1 Tax=[Mycobacterium] burgundiense TaxID=3064286 RepID=A0ABM9LVP2_9MYCO|nr:alpha/beta hydrolase [Mycolicibacterium sp. MU0053]CAJ1505520.1 alpha/beta hydrolase [Mycolicibacterium sp. MU0053]
MPNDQHFVTTGATIAYQLNGPDIAVPIGYGHGVLMSRTIVRGLGVFDIDAIAEGRRLLTYDQRGHGLSSGRPEPADYRFEQAATDLLGVLDVAGLDEPIDFAGSSLGAAAALYAVLDAPERFRRLALLIPPVAWETGPDQRRQWYFETADLIDDIGPTAWRQRWAEAPPLPIFADYPQGQFTPGVSDAVASSALRGVGSSDLPDPHRLTSIRQPTLVLAWDTDPLHPTATAERIADLIPDCTLHVARTVDEVQSWTRLTATFFNG